MLATERDEPFAEVENHCHIAPQVMHDSRPPQGVSDTRRMRQGRGEIYPGARALGGLIGISENHNVTAPWP